MYKIKTLKNGLRLILSPLKETKAVTVLVLVGVGSRYEQKNINGVSHFIEHMMFKGTKKRPTSLDISKELDGVGANFNAFTSKDHTGYYIKIASDKIELAFDLLSDMIFNSKFELEELNKERGVIVEEINMYEDNPLFYISHLFEETVFGNHPLGWQISGPKQVIKKVTRKQILDYKDSFYQPKNMLVTVAGKFEQNKVNNLANKYFISQIKSKQTKTPKKIKIEQKKPQLNLKYKETQQVHLSLGFPAYSYFNKNYYALSLLTIILGGNMSSRLFTEIREKRGLAYYIKADISSYQDTGIFTVQAGLDKQRIDSAIEVILSELKKVRTNGVTSKELKAAKEYLKGKIILELEDSENIADWYSKQELLLHKILTPEQRLKKVFAVNLSNIKRAAADVIKENKLNMAIIGPYKDKKKFQKLLKI